ncbi:hypothetical protein OC845_006754 [Tilletia horrida]|nr:hypothetical protein OC845_006754 [Tilletia horrida]
MTPPEPLPFRSAEAVSSPSAEQRSYSPAAADLPPAPDPTRADVKVKQEHCVWSADDDETFLMELEEAQQQKLQSGGGFKPQVWQKIADKLALTWTKGAVKSAAKVHDHFRNLKASWREVHDLVKMSGFGWDDGEGRVTASDSVWDALCATAPKYRKWKTRTFPYYERWTLLCATCTASGRFARDGQNEIEAVELSDDESSDDEAVVVTHKRKRPSGAGALSEIAAAIKAMVGTNEGSSNIGSLMNELLELDGDDFDTDEIASLGFLLAERPNLVTMYRSLDTREELRRALLQRILRT